MYLISKGPQLFKFGDMSNKIGDDNCSGVVSLEVEWFRKNEYWGNCRA